MTEPCSLIPVALNGSEQLLLVGDHKQLGPCVTGEAAQEGLSVTLFERLLMAGAKPFPLNIQYRMHPAIAAFPNRHFYEGKLETSVDIAQYRPPRPLTHPVTFCHVTGRETARASKSNAAEAEAVRRLVCELCGVGDVQLGGIGVITPYRAMVGLLRKLLGADFPGVEINTVDAFQGREKDVIIFACVRANDVGNMGFLADARRMNVALTRARLACVVAGNKPFLSAGNSLWKEW